MDLGGPWHSFLSTSKVRKRRGGTALRESQGFFRVQKWCPNSEAMMRQIHSLLTTNLLQFVNCARDPLCFGRNSAFFFQVWTSSPNDEMLYVRFIRFIVWLYSMTFMFSKVSVIGIGELCTYLGEAPADGFTLVRWDLRQKQSTADSSIVATMLPWNSRHLICWEVWLRSLANSQTAPQLQHDAGSFM